MSLRLVFRMQNRLITNRLYALSLSDPIEVDGGEEAGIDGADLSHVLGIEAGAVAQIEQAVIGQ